MNSKVSEVKEGRTEVEVWGTIGREQGRNTHEKEKREQGRLRGMRLGDKNTIQAPPPCHRLYSMGWRGQKDEALVCVWRARLMSSPSFHVDGRTDRCTNPLPVA